MKNITFALVLGIFAAGTVSAADFNLDSVTLAQISAAPVPPAPAAQPPLRVKTGRYTQVSAYVTLNANPWMPANGGYTSANFTGWATFRDATGQVTSNNTYINTSASLWLRPNQNVFQTIRPNVSVQLYYKGKPAGYATMSGSINISGWPGASGMVNLNGSGQLSGSIYVEDEE